ncbi:hypothetical protein FA10DRAFT_300974 [Acaromyces ingoldii]|uniref:U6 snRNA phosphodiesterase 1 n=1 Tax=Acaromyces ingoldii TaxID=215250 RepID=A0A316YXH1_9BASI|nr:hypothetical protein FA10DRAFT_300974 [Acaromyces ingoldii]PWN92495.1 hypothetical protein FA10DRAFT_300974 [Acaromyces ingoldii]
MSTKRSLVPYAESESDKESDTAGPSTTVKSGERDRDGVKAKKKRKRLPAFDDAEDAGTSKEQRQVHTSTGVASTEPLKGDWLCYVFVPIPDGCEVFALIKKARKLLETTFHEPSGDLRSADEPLHVSLSRPILIRAHERDTLVDVVRTALSHSQPGPSLDVAFARFAHFPSHDAKRTFWAVEVGQGWRELKTVTDALDKGLGASALKARPYHAQPRFHASFASARASLGVAPESDERECENKRQQITDRLEAELSVKLRHCPPIRIGSVGVALGKEVQWVKL